MKSVIKYIKNQIRTCRGSNG